jgi:site-specific DNA-methyltransferase (adenine-specific)
MDALGPFALNRVHCGDALEMLKRLPDECFHTCVTSPPYWGLRDYGLPPTDWGDWRGCLGLEPAPEMYVEHLVRILMEVRRVLRSDGTLWLNLGDSYVSAKSRHSSNVQTLSNGKYRGEPLNGSRPDLRGHPMLKDKDLTGIPWRVAFALQAAGWWLRQDIIWHKPSPLPESVTDRCTKAHEYIFLLSKSARYYYDAESVKEKAKTEGSVHVHKPGNKMSAVAGNPMHATKPQRTMVTGAFRNRRSVWTVAAQPFRGAHFATFPPMLIQPCILAGCPKEMCPACGKPRYPIMKIVGTRDVENYTGKAEKNYESAGAQNPSDTKRRILRSMSEVKATSGYSDCGCGVRFESGVVLDPFAGAGTTGIVALQEERNFIGFDLSEKYCREIANPRIEESLHNRNLPLFDRKSNPSRKIA